MPEDRAAAPLRLFVGLIPDEEVLAHLDRVAEAVRLGWRGSRLVWTPRENLHLTLRFIGATEPARVETLHQALAAALVGSGLLRLKVGPLSTGGPPVVGLDVRGAELMVRQRAVESALVAVGVSPERRPYVPHVTLARFADRREASRFFRWAAELDAEAVRLRVPWTATDVHLLESRMAAGRTAYRSLRRFVLGPAGPESHRSD